MLQHYDENDGEIEGPEPWVFEPLAYCLVLEKLTLRDHAMFLLRNALWSEVKSCDLDKFHMIYEEGFLDFLDLDFIAVDVWGDDE